MAASFIRIPGMELAPEKAITTYKKISRFFFHYLVFFVAIAIGIIIFPYFLSKSTNIQIFQNNDTLLIQKTKLIAGFNKFLKQNIKDNDLSLLILQGDLQTENGFIISIDNLITYKGLVAPRYFSLYSTIPVKEIGYFSGGSYNPDEVENFIDTFVFTKKMTANAPFTRVQLPLQQSLKDDFNLSCLFENKLSRSACNYYLEDFLSSFFVYAISKDYPGLKAIFTTIKDMPPQKEEFCDGLSKYLLYTSDQDDTIKELFSLCGPEYEETFKQTIFFMEIENSLKNQVFDKTSYKYPLLNEYKLLSYQQQIYQDFLINKVDTYKISSYLDFLREILQKNVIDPFYYDESYRYNNRYLSPALEKTAYQSSTFTQNLGSSKIASLLTTIQTLNAGEPLLGFSGLVASIQNKQLILQASENSGTGEISLTMQEKIQKKLQSISYLTIEKKSISASTIDIIGYLKFSSPDKTQNIKAHIIMSYTDDMLIITSMELQNKPEINDIISHLLSVQEFSLGELYSYISKNLVFYEQENASFTAAEDLCQELATIKNIQIKTCSSSSAIIKQGNIEYDFSIKDGGISSISVSDKTLENAIKTSYSDIIGNSISLSESIKAIIAYQAPAQIHEGTTNAILVFERIQQYLGIKANDIADSSGKILVDLTIGGINFVAGYTIASNTLGPWYFKDIRVNGLPYLIQNLNLSLDDAHQNTINTFVIDPVSAIKNADLTAWQNYQERLKTVKN